MMIRWCKDKIYQIRMIEIIFFEIKDNEFKYLWKIKHHLAWNINEIFLIIYILNVIDLLKCLDVIQVNIVISIVNEYTINFINI